MAPEQPWAWVQAYAHRAETPHNVGLGLYLRTSVCLICLAPEIQDGRETLVTDWWEAEFLCGFCGVKGAVNLPQLAARLASEGQW